MPTKPTRNRPLAAYGRNRGTQEWPVVSIATRPLVKRRKSSPTDLTRLWVRGAMPCLVIQPVYQRIASIVTGARSEEHTSELQSRGHLVCRLLLEKKKAP